MLSAPHPDNEEDRLKKLYELDILDTLEEQAYDDLTHIAAQICNVPIALISLIDRDRQFLKSHHGLDVNEVSRELGFCPHAILNDDLTIVEDTSKDERFHDNPLVTDGPRVKFYAGAPLIFPNNIRLGTLCIVDHAARTITLEQQKALEALEALARQVVAQLVQRTTIKELEISNEHRSEVLTALKRTEARERSRSEILEKLAKGDSLTEVLESIVFSIESELNGSLCSILLLDDEGEHLLTGAAPNLPKFYNDAIHNLEIGPEVGSCGAAAHSGQRIIVDNIQNHPYWEPFKALTSKVGLAACWSEPIFSSEGKVHGTFAIYHTSSHAPDDTDIVVIEYAAKLAGIAIQRKQEEMALLTAIRSAEIASQAKSEFLSNMSHELRTPLNAILGFGQLLEMDIQDDEHKESAKEIVKAGDHLLELINEILDLSKIEAGKLVLSLENCSLNNILIECITLIKPLAAQREIQVVDNITNIAHHFVHADFTRFKQVILNLLSNAVKYNIEKGTITLNCEVIDNKHLRVYVTDTGRGLSEQQQQGLFMPFERLKEGDGIEGTGIGLVISKRLVELMAGSIGVESDVDNGSTFWVQIPISEVDEKPSLLLESASEQAGGMKVKPSEQGLILYVEDNPANLRLVEQIIGSYTSYSLISSPDASLGLALAETRQPDLILMDINLPGMDGYEAMKCLQENKATQHIPVVAISANAMLSDIKKSKAARFQEYLTKPINVTTLLSVLRQMLS